MMMNQLNAGQAAGGSRLTEVQGELSRLTETVDDLHKTANTLFARLSDVQRPQGPDTPAVASTEPLRPVLCPMADRIRSVRESVADLALELERNRNLLEI